MDVSIETIEKVQAEAIVTEIQAQASIAEAGAEVIVAQAEAAIANAEADTAIAEATAAVAAEIVESQIPKEETWREENSKLLTAIQESLSSQQTQLTELNQKFQANQTEMAAILLSLSQPKQLLVQEPSTEVVPVVEANPVSATENPPAVKQEKTPEAKKRVRKI